MARIQVDMFEVQLGAALLLQFQAQRGGPVRVLADAGVKAAGYPVDHVHRKLQEAFESFGHAERRIDLIIGTHYDEDHLKGLVPIITDQTIQIGEAWLPPVANDTEPRTVGGPLDDQQLLVRQLAAEDGPERLVAYLRVKAGVCGQAASMERAADALRPTRAVRPPAPEVTGQEPGDAGDLEAWSRLFAAHEDDAAITLAARGVDLSHAGVDLRSRDAQLGPAASGTAGDSEDQPGDLEAQLWTRWRTDPDAAEADAADLAAIRRAAARDAINAIALARVAAALTARGIPIRCPVIDEGVPQLFTWRAARRRFVPGAPSRGGRGPELVLLGPSEALVRKHWARLPVGGYLTREAGLKIPILGITPSNQLSYVFRVGFDGQGILVSGDTGFVDFVDQAGGYHQGLLDALLPLEVVQVAHHAGSNAHFYRALLAAGYPEPKSDSLLLVSHATQDRFRPSEEFATFMERARAGGANALILFTSQPQAERARSFLSAIHPVVGEPSAVGDVRATFSDARWTVTRHAVAV